MKRIIKAARLITLCCILAATITFAEEKALGKEPNKPNLDPNHEVIKTGMAKLIRSALGEPNEQNLTKEQRISGLVQLWSAIKYKCAVLEYAEVNWDKILPEYFVKAEQAKDNEQYYLVLEEMIALVKDNHTYLEIRPRRENLYKPNIYIEPIEGQYRITGFYDNSNLAADIEIGDIIVAVDGKPVEQCVDEVKAYICASSEIERIHRALDRMLWRTKGENVTLEVKRGQKSLDFILPAVVPNQQWFNRIPRVFSYRLIDEKYGYIRIQNFWDEHIVEDFTKALEQLKESKGLILDLRENGGGDERKGIQIAGRLVQKQIYFHQPELESVSLKIVQEVIDSKIKDANELKTKYCMGAVPCGPWQYDKPVVILVNWRTGSAAEGFTAGLKYSGRACVIGERTSGGTGNPYYVELPGGAKGRICCNKSNNPDGSRLQGVGIQPDIPVKRTIKGIAEGRDEILEEAIKYLEKIK